MEYKLVIGYARVHLEYNSLNGFELDENSLKGIKDFEQKVNLMINEGWIPQGGVLSKNGVHTQAMIRHNNNSQNT